MARVSFRTINPAKLQSDAHISSDDNEVRHIPHYTEYSRPQNVEAFEDTLGQWLRDAYRPPLMRTLTHGGESGYANTSSSSTNVPQAEDRQSNPLPRTESRNSALELELEAKPFFQRSMIFLRLTPPSRYFFERSRGYGRSQPFMAQDVHVWQQIKQHKWNLLILDELDVITFINYWFECHFTWDVLENMFALQACAGLFDTIIMGHAEDAQLGNVLIDTIVDPHEDSSELQRTIQVEWSCKVCEEDGKPTVNTALQPKSGHSDSSIYRHDFCSSCLTYRYDDLVWLCLGPPKRSWPRDRSKPCRRAVRMSDAKVGVPCCSACETTRHGFSEGAVFGKFANWEDEPLPEKTLRA